VTLVAAAGCAEDVDSVDVRTDGIYADLELRAEGDGKAKVTASLLVGGARSDTYLNLTEGDELIAHLGGAERDMREISSAIGVFVYRAEFDGEDPDTYRVEFRRTAHSEEEAKCRGGDAPFSYSTLPPPFSMQVQTADGFSRDDDNLTISWSPSGGSDGMSLAVRGSCIRDYTTDLGDTGSRTIAAGTLKPIGEMAEDCQLSVTIDRARMGEVDENYGEGGTFRAVQSRASSLESTP